MKVWIWILIIVAVAVIAVIVGRKTVPCGCGKSKGVADTTKTAGSPKPGIDFVATKEATDKTIIANAAEKVV